MPIQQSIPFDNSFAKEMDGFYVPQVAANFPKPTVVQFNAGLAKELGFDEVVFNSDEGAGFFSGQDIPDNAFPLSQVYAGHQFGGFSPQLGDGRALLLGEVVDQKNTRYDIQLKGSGPTTFSRRGDGKAVIGPVLREYLMGEAMHALNIPTTRALAAVTTGEKVMRDGFQPGAILTRVASSHLRVGTFQFFAARQDHEKLKQLADYSIKRHYSEFANHKEKYLELLKAVQAKQASLIAKWMSVGFVHGVMNTDNMTISGETIDYGPCAFMDHYDAKVVFSSIDEQGRYAYGNQPVIAQWNLARFAETLIPLINPEDSDQAIQLATDELNKFPELYQDKWLDEMRAKLGLVDPKESDLDLVNTLFKAMDRQHVDYTKLFRKVADAARGETHDLFKLFNDKASIKSWVERWLKRLSQNNIALNECADGMDRVNPIYIARNHKVEEALQAATVKSDYKPFEKLLGILSNPYKKQDGMEAYEESASDGAAPYVTFCGT